MKQRYLTGGSVTLCGMGLLAASLLSPVHSGPVLAAHAVPADITPYVAPTIAPVQSTPIATYVAPTVAPYHATIIQPYTAQLIQPWSAPPIASYTAPLIGIHAAHIVPAYNGKPLVGMYVASLVKPVEGHVISSYEAHTISYYKSDGTSAHYYGQSSGGFVPLDVWDLPANASPFAVAEVASAYVNIQNSYRDDPLPYSGSYGTDSSCYGCLGASPNGVTATGSVGMRSSTALPAGGRVQMGKLKRGVYYRVVVRLHADGRGHIHARLPFTFHSNVATRALLVLQMTVHGKTVARARYFNVLP